MSKHTVTIPSEKFPEFIKKVTSLNKKAQKIGGSVYYQIVGHVASERENLIPKLKIDIFSDLTVSDYKIVGSIKMSGMNEFRYGTIPEQFHNNDFHCDHCGVNNNRARVLILNSELNDSYIQVGYGCVGKYFQIKNPTKLLSLFDSVSDFAESTGSWTASLGSGKAYVTKEVYIDACVKSILAKGYHNSSSNNPTRDDALGWISHSSRDPKTEEVLNNINDAVATLNGDFLHNVQIALMESVLSSREFGYVAYAVYLTLFPKQLKSTEKKPKYEFVEEFSKLSGRNSFEVKCVWKKWIDNDFGGSLLLKFEGIKNKNLSLTSFYSGNEDFDINEVYKFKATIKKYEQFKGDWSILVNRISLI